MMSFSVVTLAQQFSCETICTDTLFLRPISALEYIPDSFTSMKYVQVNFHFVMKSDSTCNFSPFDDGNGNCNFTAYDYSNALINYANIMLSDNQSMNLPLGNNTSALQSQFRLRLESVSFDYDDDDYTYYYEPNKLDWDDVGFYSIFAESQINVFFVYNDKGDNNYNNCVGRARPNGNRAVIIGGVWQLYNSGGGNDGFWSNAWLLIHEIGHTMSLLHTMQAGDTCRDINDYCYDTPLYSEVLNETGIDPCPSWGCDVTYCSNNLMDYSGHRAITPEQLGRIHYTLMHDMFLYIYDDYCNINQNENECILQTGQSLTWQNDRILKNNLIINTGSQLIIKDCLIHLAEGASIIVKPGGVLVIDGATITNRCGQTWNGIEVWGNRNENQFLENGVYHQGYLELKNGATIENAICAVELWRPGYRGCTGGIIHADNAVFRNNAKSVRAMDYVNIDPSTNQETDYNGYFRRCTFIIDQDYHGLTTFKEHADLNLIKGISFAGCDFSVDRDAPGLSSTCYGINAFNASFEVTFLPASYQNDFIPSPNYISSSFSGFHIGICSNSSGFNPCTFTVCRSVFNRNRIGVGAKNNSFACIVQNTFNIGDDSDCAYGVFLGGVNHFCIEDNQFTAVQNTTSATFGIGIHNTTTDNDVHLNEFNDLSIANVAIGQNNNGHPGIVGRTAGLTYSCNSNDSNSTDFCVVGEDNTISGICVSQGSSFAPCSNSFSGSQYHFYNSGDYLIDYFFANTLGQVPDASKLYQVNAVLTYCVNECSRHYSNGCFVRTGEEIDQLEEEYLQAFRSYEDIMGQLVNRIDGGNTPLLISRIDGATPEDQEQLKYLLLEYSPYLSMEVLMAIANKRNVFDNQSVFEIFAANPDVLKIGGLFDYLESMESPLPSEMITQLRKMAYNTTDRTLQMAQLSRYAHDFSFAASDVVRSCLCDSITNYSLLRKWIDDLHDLPSDHVAIASYLQEGNYMEALELANKLPERYDFQQTELHDYNDYLSLLNLQKTLQESNRTVFEMTESEMEMVQKIVDEGFGLSKSYAEVILSEIMGRDEIDVDCQLLQEVLYDRDSNTSFELKKNENSNLKVIVSPNPANNCVCVDYELPTGIVQASFSIVNLLGIMEKTSNIQNNAGMLVVDLQDLEPGVYVFVFRCKGYEERGKIVITK